MKSKHLEKLKALEKKASPMPWKIESGNLVTGKQGYVYGGYLVKHDARLIVEMRESLPLLLAEIDFLRGENELYRAGIKRIADEIYVESDSFCTMDDVIDAAIERVQPWMGDYLVQKMEDDS